MVWYIMGWVNLWLWGYVRGLVLLVVAVTAIADYVDEDVFVELLTILYGDLHCLVHKLWLISVHVKYWSLDRFCDVSTIKTSSGFGRSCSKTNLIICYDMDDTIGLIMRKISHLKAFINYTLPSNSCITMNQNT